MSMYEPSLKTVIIDSNNLEQDVTHLSKDLIFHLQRTTEGLTNHRNGIKWKKIIKGYKKTVSSYFREKQHRQQNLEPDLLVISQRGMGLV